MIAAWLRIALQKDRQRPDRDIVTLIREQIRLFAFREIRDCLEQF
jgi:hypothetical protein